jgi:hypothetical protein
MNPRNPSTTVNIGINRSQVESKQIYKMSDSQYYFPIQVVDPGKMVVDS